MNQLWRGLDYFMFDKILKLATKEVIELKNNNIYDIIHTFTHSYNAQNTLP